MVCDDERVAIVAQVVYEARPSIDMFPCHLCDLWWYCKGFDCVCEEFGYYIYFVKRNKKNYV